MLLQTSDNLVAIVTRRDDVFFQPLHYSDEKIIFTSGRVFLKTILETNADTKLDVLLIYIDDCMRRYIDSTDVWFWKTTPTTRLQLREQQVSLICSGYELELHQKLFKYTKEANAMTRRVDLLEVKIAATEAAINARNIRKYQSAKTLSTGGILYVKDARSMTSDRLDLEKLRQKTRDDRSEKQYLNELIKVYKRCKAHIKVWQKEKKAWKVLYKAVLKELRVKQPLQK